MIERTSTVGRVVAAGGVEIERVNTGGRVGAAGSVAVERCSTGGRVLDATGVLIERFPTNGRVAVAGSEAEKRILALSGVKVGIASVRCRAKLRPSRWGKGKRCNGERNEEETAYNPDWLDTR